MTTDAEPYNEKKELDKSKIKQELFDHFENLKVIDKDDVERRLRKLMRLGASDASECEDGKHGENLLHRAAWRGDVDVANFLIKKHEIDVNKPDGLGKTPLHIAAANNMPEMVELLLKCGANIEGRTSDGQTPLHCAAKRDAVLCIELLVARKADKEAKDNRQRTPLFVAAEFDRSAAAHGLLQHSADARAVDMDGAKCLSRMIQNMPTMALLALDQYHEMDRAERKQYYYLHDLADPRDEYASETSPAKPAKSPFEVIVALRQLRLVIHPAVKRLIQVKWEQFGRLHTVGWLCLNIGYAAVWSVFAVVVPWYRRPVYIFPQEGYRVFFITFGILLTIVLFGFEWREYRKTKSRNREWMEWRKEQIQEDLKLIDKRWQKDEKYLTKSIDKISNMESSNIYGFFIIRHLTSDFWNGFDVIAYFLVILFTILHIVNAALASRPGPCCFTQLGNLTEVCMENDLTCEGDYVNNNSLTVWNNRLLVFAIMMLWIRPMKFLRAFESFGPLVVTIGKFWADVGRFFVIALVFFVAYGFAFWTVYGWRDTFSLSRPDQLLYMLYRIALVDDYPYDEMHQFDVVMAYLLISSFVFISAILCINILIAMLSDSFRRVYDNAQANALMQRAIEILQHEQNLGKKKRKEHKCFLKEKCNPESLDYDDDITIAEDQHLQRHTEQIKDQLEVVQDLIRTSEKSTEIKMNALAKEIVDMKRITNGCIEEMKKFLNDMLLTGMTQEAEVTQQDAPLQHSQADGTAEQASRTSGGPPLARFQPSLSRDSELEDSTHGTRVKYVRVRGKE